MAQEASGLRRAAAAVLKEAQEYHKLADLLDERIQLVPV
jgi:hypothetical protein